MDVLTLHNLLNKYRERTHGRVQWRLVEIGRGLGYEAIAEYDVYNLVPNRPRSIIDVVWLLGDRIAVAFEVRMKRRDLDVPTSEKDKEKLTRLNADEKFFINASRITGATYIFKMAESGEWLVP